MDSSASITSLPKLETPYSEDKITQRMQKTEKKLTQPVRDISPSGSESSSYVQVKKVKKVSRQTVYKKDKEPTSYTTTETETKQTREVILNTDPARPLFPRLFYFEEHFKRLKLLKEPVA